MFTHVFIIEHPCLYNTLKLPYLFIYCKIIIILFSSFFTVTRPALSSLCFLDVPSKRIGSSKLLSLLALRLCFDVLHLFSIIL